MSLLLLFRGDTNLAGTTPVRWAAASITPSDAFPGRALAYCWAGASITPSDATVGRVQP